MASKRFVLTAVGGTVGLSVCASAQPANVDSSAPAIAPGTTELLGSRNEPYASGVSRTSTGRFENTPSEFAAFTIASADSNLSSQAFLVTQRNASTIWRWNPIGTIQPFLSARSNDADYNRTQGSTHGWLAEHFADYFAQLDINNGSGMIAQYTLGTGGRTHYHYPKHIAVYDNSVVIMSRTGGTIWRYTFEGQELTSQATGFSTGQGLATDGTDLYVSVWNGSVSQFLRYDTGLNQIGGPIPNPTGMGNNNNLVDFAYDEATEHWFGLATVGEGGTGTQTNQIVEFTMGGSVVAQYTLPFLADGFGLAGVPEFCPCSCSFDLSTGHGVCDIFDFLAFQTAFVAGEWCACQIDTSSGYLVCDIYDFLAFQNGMVSGCP